MSGKMFKFDDLYTKFICWSPSELFMNELILQLITIQSHQTEGLSV